MEFREKYIKYKNKYLEIKGTGSFGPVALRGFTSRGGKLDTNSFIYQLENIFENSNISNLSFILDVYSLSAEPYHKILHNIITDKDLYKFKKITNLTKIINFEDGTKNNIKIIYDQDKDTYILEYTFKFLYESANVYLTLVVKEDRSGTITIHNVAGQDSFTTTILFNYFNLVQEINIL